MLKNYLLVTLRSLSRNKTVSLIHIVGFGLGIAAFLFAARIIVFHYSFDSFPEDRSRIYKISADYTLPGGEIRTGSAIQPALVPILKENIPEIVYSARFIPQLLEEMYCVITLADSTNGKRSFNESSAYYVDEDFLKIFNFKILSGNRTNPLTSPSGLVMTKSCAEKYFGSENPVGKSVELTTGGTESNKTRFLYRVDAIVEDVPVNSSIQFNILLPFRNFEDHYKIDVRSNWRWHGCFSSFIQVSDDMTNLAALEQKITLTVPKEVRDNWMQTGVKDVNYKLVSMKEMHFETSTQFFKAIQTTQKSHLLILAIIGLAILIVAEMNYISLTTAKAYKRMKEIGIRKVVGADRTQLAIQFMVDASVSVALGTIFALTVLQMTSPLLAEWLSMPAPRTIGFDQLSLVFIAIFLISVLVMGLVPVYFLSRTIPVHGVKSTSYSNPSGSWMRKCLVVFQFVTSVLLICLTYVIISQLLFMRNTDTGLALNNRLVIRALGTEDFDKVKYRQFKNMALQDRGIRSVATGNNIPGEFYGDSPPWSSPDHPTESGHLPFIQHAILELDYMKTLGIPVIEGRDFVEQDFEDRVCLINESAIRHIGYKSAGDALGRRLIFHWLEERREVRIVGVVSDALFMSPGLGPEPAIFTLGNTTHPFPKYAHYIVELATDQSQEALDRLKALWEQTHPNAPFEYYFLSDGIEKVFEDDKKVLSVASLSAVLALIIACLGLGGLVAHSVTQRTKEIGIRKTLGASVSRILYLLSREYLRLILLAILIALPLAWHIADQFLSRYQNRIGLSLWIFVLPCMVLLLITVATMAFQTMRAANTNPVEALKHE